MLKIYSQDNTWAGLIVVVAASEEEARLIMAKDASYGYCPERDVEEDAIYEGLSIVNYGDS